MSFAPFSVKQGDSISAYRIVRVTSADTVAVCSAATDVPFGITQDEAGKSNQAVPVAISGVCRVYVNDSIAAGGFIMTDAVGRAIPYVAASTGNYAVGVLIGPKVNATGAIVEVLLQPQWRASLA